MLMALRGLGSDSFLSILFKCPFILNCLIPLIVLIVYVKPFGLACCWNVLHKWTCLALAWLLQKKGSGSTDEQEEQKNKRTNDFFLHQPLYRFEVHVLMYNYTWTITLCVSVLKCTSLWGVWIMFTVYYRDKLWQLDPNKNAFCCLTPVYEFLSSLLVVKRLMDKIWCLVN